VFVIQLSGKQGSGKSTTARAIESKFRSNGIAVTPHRFASALYDVHDAVYAILAPLGVVEQTKKDGLLLQVLGDEWGRKKNPNIWVDAAKAHYAQIEKHFEGSNVTPVGLLEDTRYINEFHAFDNAIRVRLECAEDARKVRTDAWRENTTHRSEIDLDEYVAQGKFDLVLDTNTLSTDLVVDMILDLYKERVASGQSSNP